MPKVDPRGQRRRFSTMGRDLTYLRFMNERTIQRPCRTRSPASRSWRFVGLTTLISALGCHGADPPGADRNGPKEVIAGALGVSDSSAQAAGDVDGVGTLEDNLPFEPSGEKVASIAWRTWIYTDTGPQRTRLGYLRAGTVMDARGPLLRNDGCKGGWLRINPRGFVCLGKGATQDLGHAVVLQGKTRAVRGESFPYLYAMGRDEPPQRYFKLPSKKQLVEIEGKRVLDRAANWMARASAQGLTERLQLSEVLPEFLDSAGALVKPYGVKQHLRHLVHAGQANHDSGFALVDTFVHDGRGYGVSSEMDILPLDRLQIIDPNPLAGVEFAEGETLPAAFHVRGGITLWERSDSGSFIPTSEQREKRGFKLTGERATGGMIETTEGFWLVESSVRVIQPREGFPSVATGRRKWIDVSIKHQSLVAYEGKRAVYATLISGGRGGLGEKGDSNPDGNRTVRGTFMIHEKSISSTMDGEEDRADSYDLQDVPFVQYFHRGFALHGAYWHEEFGRKRSHGCVNLGPRDSAWLFEWTDPPVPAGWHAALNKKRGTVVSVGY